MRTIGLTFPKVVAPPQPPKEAPVKKETVKKSKQVLIMYADLEYYKNTYGGKLPEEDAEKALKQASRHIDTLTYNRIVDIERLTAYQQGIIKECTCMMADFESTNASMINSLINSYSINGASVSFSGECANCQLVNGVIVQKDVYAYLAQTGLTCRSLGV